MAREEGQPNEADGETYLGIGGAGITRGLFFFFLKTVSWQVV